MSQSRGAKATMAKQEDEARAREEDTGEAQEAEAEEEDPVPDLYEYIRDAPWQGPYGDPNSGLEPDLEEGTDEDPWAEAWPDQDWPDDPWPNDPWPGEPETGEPLVEEPETGEGPRTGEGRE